MFHSHEIRRTSAKAGQSVRQSAPRSQEPSAIDYLQQTIGNRALSRMIQSRNPVMGTGSSTISGTPADGMTLQRMINNADGQQVPIDWEKITEDELIAVFDKVDDGTYILEESDQNHLLDAISRHEQANPGKPTKMEEEEKEASQDQERLVDDEYDDFLKQTYKESEDEQEEEDPTYDGEKEFSPEQQEIYDKFHPIYKARMEEKKRKYPGKSAQGSMLEYNFSAFSSDMDIQEIDGNAASKNIPGIDHLVDTPSHLFVQDKLHLSEHTAKPGTYRKHYQNRPKMAKNFLKSMATDGKRGDSLRSMMKSIKDSPNWNNKKSAVTIHDGVEKHRQDYQDAVKDEEADTLPNIEDNKELIDQIATKIAFSIPSDMWELLNADPTILKEEMSAYVRLDMSTSDFKKILDRMQDVVAPWNEKGIKSDDEAFVDPEEKEREQNGEQDEEEAEALDRKEEEDQADEEEDLGARSKGRDRKRRKITKHSD